MTSPLQTALSGLLADATAGPWIVDDAYVRQPDGTAIAYVGDDLQDAALIVAAVRAVRWAHSDAGLEAIAAEISDVCNVPWSQAPDGDKRHCRTIARAIVAAVAEAGVG